MKHLRALLAGLGIFLLLIVAAPGCAPGPTLVPEATRKPIDRRFVEYPAGYELKPFARGLSNPSSIAFVTDEGEYKNSILIAESGVDNLRPRIYGYKPDGTFFSIYPRGGKLPTLGIFKSGRELYGPIGGMVYANGYIYVTHRDARDRGMVTRFDLQGNRMTVVGDLPAMGDHSVTDIAVHPTTGKLWFGLGSATNSGVVGLDNWQVGWVKSHLDFCDLPAVNLKLLGFKFFSRNPNAGLFGGDDNVGTAPYQPFGKSYQLRVRQAPNDRPTSAIYSVSPTGGDLRVEAHGIRLPRGLAFDEYSNLFATNNGMEMRGSRPVRDDPDALLKIISGTWYGFPDYSADVLPISDARFLPPPNIMIRTDYPELSAVIDHAGSGLPSPTLFRDTILFGTLPSQSGASKLVIIPESGSSRFPDYRGDAIIALRGDRAPFATYGQKLRGPIGRKLVAVNLVTRRAEDFVYNTEPLPASRIGRNVEALERPVDVKLGPDGKLYILDMGQMKMRGGKEKVAPGSGRIFVLEPASPASTQPPQ
ncbi:PQQ-dependent sugar dehydrogenase [Fontivita pretiosa]|uniref:PQQ-dependent sugar dehydrogenase n=1 Tax=Fontivita pretiosa TaxID=2989684 RepID=UPI003D167C83